jgi:hypothetical protein
MGQNLPQAPVAGYPTWIYMVLGVILRLIFLQVIAWIMAILFVILYGDSNTDPSVLRIIGVDLEVLAFFAGIFSGYLLSKRRFKF